MGELLSKLPVNWDLLKNPANWIIVFLMVALAVAGLAVVMTASNNPAATGDN